MTINIFLLNLLSEKYISIDEISYIMSCHQKTIKRQLEKIKKLIFVELIEWEKEINNEFVTFYKIKVKNCPEDMV